MDIRDTFSAIHMAFGCDCEVRNTTITEIIHEGGDPTGRVMIAFDVKNTLDEDEAQYRIYDCLQLRGGSHFEVEWYNVPDQKWEAEDWHGATFEEALDMLVDHFDGTGA